MFKIKQDPAFPGSIKIVSMGREQTLNVTFRAKTRTEFDALLKSVKKDGDEVGVFLALVEGWDADLPLDAASVSALNDHQPGAVWHVIDAYKEALIAARRGN
jgi:hypothetical protein